MQEKDKQAPDETQDKKNADIPPEVENVPEDKETPADKDASEDEVPESEPKKKDREWKKEARSPGSRADCVTEKAGRCKEGAGRGK